MKTKNLIVILFTLVLTSCTSCNMEESKAIPIIKQRTPNCVVVKKVTNNIVEPDRYISTDSFGTVFIWDCDNQKVSAITDAEK